MLILLEPKSSLENFHFATIGWLNRDRQLNKSHNVQYKVVYLQKNKLHSNMYYTGWNCCNSWCFMSWGSIQGEHHPNFHWSMYLFQCLIRSHLESTCQNKCLRRVLASECSRRLIVELIFKSSVVTESEGLPYLGNQSMCQVSVTIAKILKERKKHISSLNST